MEVPGEKKRKRSITPSGQVPVRQRLLGSNSEEHVQEEGIAPQITVSHPPESNNQQVPPLKHSISSEESFEWSLVQSSNIDLDQLTTRSGSPADGYIIPENVTYSLSVTFEGNKLPNAPEKVSMQPNNPSSYEDIERKAQNFVEAKCDPTSLAGKSVNFRYGDCTITCDNHDNHDWNDIGKHTQGLSTKADWKDICTVLANIWERSRHRAMHLDIHREYIGLLIRRISDESFAEAKRREISNLMKSAFDGREYISRIDLLRVASMDMIRAIIGEDHTIEQDEREELILEANEKAPILTIMCVHAQLGMKCLKTLLAQGISDKSYPLEEKQCCHKNYCKPNFKNLLQYQGGFHAAVFFSLGEHKKHHKGTVIPIHYYPKAIDSVASTDSYQGSVSEEEAENNNEDKESDKYRAHCGSGAYSNVYRVQIDPAHHKLAKDKNAAFAVKEFKDRPLRKGSDFAKELKILDQLREYPHQNIVTHLATWIQDDKYYMLFHYAECNMRQYMKQNTFGEPTKRKLRWLLEQFEALAIALRHIHNLSGSKTGSETTTNLLAPTQQDLRKSGWHHDLKPENILFFKFPGSRYGVFQVADFGSGKVHTYRSGSFNTRSANGTLTYEPPEAAKEGATSRPYDMWSMGCVFLELLIWATCGYSCVKTFRSNREERRFPGSQTDILNDDAFWQMDVHGNVQRRASVDEWFNRLHDEMERKNLQILRVVLDLVDRMLDKDRQTRITALDLWDTVDRIYSQAKIDLADVKDDSMPEQSSRETASSHLPRLSTKAPDRRTPDPVSPTAIHRPEGNSPRSPYPWIDDRLLTASPLAHRRNSSTSDATALTEDRTRQRSHSNASSTYVQAGSSIHSHGGRTPDPSNP